MTRNVNIARLCTVMCRAEWHCV